MDQPQMSMNQRIQTAQFTAPSLLLPKSLYPTDPLPTITTLDPSSSRYPTRSSISSLHNPTQSAEDELHSEPEGQQGDTKQESGEGGTTSDFVKKLYRCAFELQFDFFIV